MTIFIYVDDHLYFEIFHRQKNRNYWWVPLSHNMLTFHVPSNDSFEIYPERYSRWLPFLNIGLALLYLVLFGDDSSGLQE